MAFFNKINNNTIVDTLKQLRNRRDCKILCTNVPQADTFDEDVFLWKQQVHTIDKQVDQCVSELIENDQCGVC